MLVSDRVYYVHAGLCAHMCIHISGHHGVEFSSIRAPMCQGRQFLRLSCACTRIIWTYEFICPGASEGTHIRVPHTCLGVSGDTQMFMNMYACMPEWGNVLVPVVETLFQLHIYKFLLQKRRSQNALWNKKITCISFGVYKHPRLLLFCYYLNGKGRLKSSHRPPSKTQGRGPKDGKSNLHHLGYPVEVWGNSIFSLIAVTQIPYFGEENNHKRI